jgi:hypothetical protein
LYFRVHRAGVRAGLVTWFMRWGFLVQISFWVLSKLLQAMFAAEIKMSVRIMERVFGITRHHHVADRIFSFPFFCIWFCTHIFVLLVSWLTVIFMRLLEKVGS